MGDEESKGYTVEIPDDAVQEALESVDRNKQSRGSGDDPEDTVVPVEIEDPGGDGPDEPAAGNSEQPAGSQGPTRQDLIETIEKLRAEAKAARDRMMRVAADADNVRKRALKERQEAVKYGQEQLMRDLLVPLDNLERTLAHLPADSPDPAVKSWKKGLEMVQLQFQEALAKHHLTSFSALGARFDPARHEALNRIERDDVEPGTVVEEMQRGYLLHDRLLRPALVAVACAPGELQSEACSDPSPGQEPEDAGAD